jgi:hypothetical protein
MKKMSRLLPAQDSTPRWVYVLVTIACISFLAIGFFFAARQHFMAMDMSIKNSKLRRQVEDMEGENRRLVLAREIVRSPSEVKRIAARRGLRDADEVFAPVAVAAKQTQAAALVQKTSMSIPSIKPEKPLKAFYGPDSKPASKQSKAVSPTLIASSKVK